MYVLVNNKLLSQYKLNCCFIFVTCIVGCHFLMATLGIINEGLSCPVVILQARCNSGNQPLIYYLRSSTKNGSLVAVLELDVFKTLRKLKKYG